MMMQVPKRHLPIVGLLGLVVVAAAGGGIYYYQFVISHVAPSYVASHRMVFMAATIVDTSPNGHGFEITNTAYLNQSSLPNFNASGPSLAGVKYTNYKGESDNSTIDAHPGDTITFYILPTNVTSLKQYPAIPGHGFSLTSPSGSVLVPITQINFGRWYAFTVTVNDSGSYLYMCTYPCSDQHYLMKGNVVVG